MYVTPAYILDLLSPLFDLLVRLELENVWVNNEDDRLFRINAVSPKTTRYCNFINTPGGCRAGASCPFLHRK